MAHGASAEIRALVREGNIANPAEAPRGYVGELLKRGIDVRQTTIVAAVRRALVRLGPDAASALPVVIELFDQPNTPLAHYSDERSSWRTAMIRMGRPLEDVPSPPRSDEEPSDLMRFLESIDKYPADDSRF